MIEVLGQSPISSVVTAGMSEFMSIFRNRPSNAFANDESRYPRAYTNVRGILIDKQFVDAGNLDKGYQFQFNPATITDTKATNYELRGYAGLPFNDYIWSGGGERIISFQLFLDNTPQSKQRHFRPTEVNHSSVGYEFQTKGEGFTYDEHTGKYTLDKRYFGQDFVDEMISVGKSIKESIIPSRGPSSFTYKDNGAAMISRVHERGILPEVELLQSFLYPAPLAGENTPLFAEGGVVSLNQFRPPATLVLALGPIYLEGVLKSAPVNYTLFDKDLTPIRGTVDIEFAVFEFANVERKIQQMH